MIYKVQTLNNISVTGLKRLPREKYEIASEITHPDAILLRSYKMHEMTIPDTVKCIGRAGTGTNNIPVEQMTAKGIPVFNAPGANANAVKELVIAGMLMSIRHLGNAWQFAQSLEGDDAEITKQVEAGKKNFAGFELPQRTIGIIGLGAIGVRLANACLSLGMKVIGFDPTLTVHNALQLDARVEQALSVDDLVSKAHFISFHVPLNNGTKNMINEDRIALMPKDTVLLNFARQGIIDDEAVVKALDSGNLHGYVCDFPSNLLKNHPKCITLPHLGASTVEAEDNCAIMVADEIKGWLEHGQVKNSVNFPEINLPRGGGIRIVVVHENTPNMIGQVSTCLADTGFNIIDLLSKCRDQIGVTLVDVENGNEAEALAKIEEINGILSVNCLGCGS